MPMGFLALLFCTSCVESMYNVCSINVIDYSFKAWVRLVTCMLCILVLSIIVTKTDLI